MSKQQKNNDFLDDSDWDNEFGYEELQAEKQQSHYKKSGNKRETRERLEEHFEKRKLRARNRFIEDYNFAGYPEI